MKKATILLIILISYKIAYSQISITAGGTAMTLAQLIAGNGVTVTNASITCDGAGYGIFTSGNMGAGNIGLSGGILLTTGNASDASGSESGIKSVSNSSPPSDPDLLTIQNNATFNTCKLEFDVVPICANLNLSYVFASEEYPDYVCATVNDACGLFISGPGITGSQNIAVIPGTTIGVAINSINGGSAGIYGSSGGCTSLAYSSLFVDNNGGNQIEYGGFTVPLTASVNVTPCQTYHLKFVIADAGDALFDSGVFFQENGITCGAPAPAVTSATICSGNNTTLTASGSTNGTYTWTPNTNLSTSSGSIVIANPIVTTVYTVTSPGGCSGLLVQTSTVTVNSTGTASITSSGPFCDIQPPITLTVSGTGGSWTGTGITNTLTGVFTPSVAGVGTHLIAYTYSNNCSNGTATTSIVVATAPASPSIAPVGPFCLSNANVSLIPNASGGMWMGTGITNSLTGVFSPSLAGSGTHVITYSLSGNCGNGSATTSITVNPSPVAYYTANAVCQTSTTSFSDLSSNSSGAINTWNWDFTNNGSVDDNSQNPTFTYPTAGTYTASLMVINSNSCSSKYSGVVTVYTNPILTIVSNNVCLGAVSQFSANTSSNNVTMSTWQWDVNNSINTFETNGQQGSYTFPSVGVFTLQLVGTTNQGCVGTASALTNVYDNPTPLFSVDIPSGCSKHCVVFTDNSAVTAPSQITNWNWNFGNGTTSNGSTNGNQATCYINSSTNQLALFTVTLTTKTDKGCTATLVKSNMITVYPTPIANYTITPNLGNVSFPQVDFINQSVDYDHWYWYYGDGPMIDSIYQNPSHYYNTEEPNSYYSMLIVSNQYGCKDTADLKIDIGPEFLFYVPNAFTPDNIDGHNDVFTGVGIGILKYDMWVYDRWGANVFYSNSINYGWDGKVLATGVMAKQDVYTWKIKIKDVFNKTHDYIGHVTLLK